MTDAAHAWAQLSGVRPRLRPHARVHRHVYRGQPWFVVEDPIAARSFRLSEPAHALVARMDGERTLTEVLAATREQAPGGAEDAPDEQALLDLVGRLRAAELLSVDLPSDAGELVGRWQCERRRRRLGALARPLSMRFPVLDPDALLGALAPLARWAFSPLGLVLWLIAVLAGVAVALGDLEGLAGHAASRLADPQNLLLLAAAYVAVKTVHELGHGLAVKAWGGEVHEMGMMLIVLFPVPYVDASAASAFASKRKRMAVGAAGIMVETVLAAGGVLVWSMVEPGAVRDAAFNVALVGGVSTVLFNANPLLRFDGYYVLADAVEIPNLASRSVSYWGYLARRYLLGVGAATSPVSAAGERAWFAVYGLASYCYRVVIGFGIALFVAGLVPVVGVLVAAWAVAGQILLPVVRQIRYLLRSPELAGRRAPRIALATAALGAVAAFAHLVPLPSTTVAEGVVRLPERSLVRAGTDGFVRAIVAADGEPIAAGAPVVALADDALDTERRVLALQIAEREAERADSLLRDRTRAQVLAEEIAELGEELDEVEREIARLVVRSPAAGTLVVPRARDAEGRFARKGDVLAYVRDRSPPVARVVVPETAIDRVRHGSTTVRVRLAARPGASVDARIVRAVPAASARLPSRTLGSLGGGAIAVDARDQEGLTAVEPVFELDLELAQEREAGFVGGRVLARFEHPPEPLTRRWARSLRQLAIAHL